MFFISSSLESKARILTDTASISWGQSYVSVFTPSLSPWIFQFPGICIYTNQKDIMIDFSTSAAIVNTRSISLPISSVYGNSQRTSIESILYICTSIEFNMSIDWFEWACLSLAITLNSFIRIFCCSNKTFFSNIDQSSISTSTLTSKSSIRGRAVNNLLFR